MKDPTTRARVLLLTGLPGVGKTTVVRAVPALLPGTRFSGFTTEEIREAGRRLGFRGTSLDGHETVIAHVAFPGPARVGRYGVNIGAIDQLTRALYPGLEVDAYLVDEVGKMECLSKAFVAAMRELLISPVRLVATVAARGGGLIAEVKAHPGGVIREVTRLNRSSLPAEVAAWFASTR
ncbi:MAG TPA: nucleoside-triphosphatase [Thermoanaerobaculaceae bacterium]|nr:nucleoside-triphosphatase [Thermoanaerobaculaceae bacterium]